MGKKDYFLEPDDAMTMGNINYMRKAIRTKRTFPKTLKNPEGFFLDNEVSSMDNRAKNKNRTNLYEQSNTAQDTTMNTVFSPVASSQGQPSITGGSAVTQTNPNTLKDNTKQIASNFKFEPVKTNAQERRKQDDGLDMFRNMAKTMRGKR
ncbi:hypothetical protein NIES4102_26340 [Chondrocystis sp. NIES-4102]|nr:hypothetical protein NIES4102_26340 [Chondrocystis sp. NIES-4102]